MRVGRGSLPSEPKTRPPRDIRESRARGDAGRPARSSGTPTARPRDAVD